MKRMKERGQSLVEMAISLTVLLYLLSGAAEFGVIFFKYIQLRDAAQEGALYGSLYPTLTPQIEARARGASTSPINLTVNNEFTGVLVFVSYPSTNCVGEPVKVEVRHRHRIFMPFMPRLIGRTHILLNASVTDTILQTADTSCPGHTPLPP